MLVSAIKGTNLEKNYSNLSFGQKERPAKQNSVIPAGLKAVPVVVLMSMNPSLLNAKLPETLTEQETLTYVVAPEAPQAGRQIRNPYGWQKLDYFDIKYRGVVNSNGVLYNVLFTSRKDKRQNEVDDIYLIPKSDMGKSIRSEHRPPCVKNLIVHDMPNGEQFSTVQVYEDVVNSRGENVAYREREIVIDDKTAQMIYDMLQGFSRSAYVDKSQIRWTIVNTPELMKEVYNPIR